MENGEWRMEKERWRAEGDQGSVRSKGKPGDARTWEKEAQEAQEAQRSQNVTIGCAFVGMCMRAGSPEFEGTSGLRGPPC